MIDIMQTLITSFRSVSLDLDSWFQEIPNGAPWRVVSDYCIGDPKKANDSFAFSIIVNHDTQENIEEYINAVAPRDLKKTRTPSKGMISYLTCPVVFNIGFVVRRHTALLKDYITEENVKSGIEELWQIFPLLEAASPETKRYYDSVRKRLRALEKYMSKSSRNLKLVRQVFLVSSMAALVFHHLERQKSPNHIRWISDRDAMFDVFDGIAFDLSFIHLIAVRLAQNILTNPPALSFALPGMDGVTQYEGLIRVADYYAGLLADINLDKLEVSHDKFRPLFRELLVEANNTALMDITIEGGILKTRRIIFPQQVGWI